MQLIENEESKVVRLQDICQSQEVFNSIERGRIANEESVQTCRHRCNLIVYNLRKRFAYTYVPVAWVAELISLFVAPYELTTEAKVQAIYLLSKAELTFQSISNQISQTIKQFTIVPDPYEGSFDILFNALMVHPQIKESWAAVLTLLGIPVMQQRFDVPQVVWFASPQPLHAFSGIKKNYINTSNFNELSLYPEEMSESYCMLRFITLVGHECQHLFFRLSVGQFDAITPDQMLESVPAEFPRESGDLFEYILFGNTPSWQ